MNAARVAISTNVPGRVIELRVHDNQRVKRGDVLFRLDDQPFQLKVNEARAKLSNAKLQIDAMKATYRQKLSELKSAARHARLREARERAPEPPALVGYLVAGPGRSCRSRAGRGSAGRRRRSTADRQHRCESRRRSVDRPDEASVPSCRRRRSSIAPSSTSRTPRSPRRTMASSRRWRSCRSATT